MFAVVVIGWAGAAKCVAEMAGLLAIWLSDDVAEIGADDDIGLPLRKSQARLRQIIVGDYGGLAQFWGPIVRKAQLNNFP